MPLRSAGVIPAPGPYHIRLVPDNLQVTWLATLFFLALGVMMMYVPYEFQANAFQLLYPYIRLVGFSFLLAALFLGLTAAYPRLLGRLNNLSRVWAILNLLMYWYTASFVSGSLTGLVLYPVMTLCLVIEGLPRFRPRGTFPVFIALVSIAFGLTMLFMPNQFSAVIYRHLQPVIYPVGFLYLIGGLGIVGSGWRRQPWLRVALFGGIALPYFYLVVALGMVGAWSGMVMYTVLALGCIVAAWAPWVNPPASVRWRLLRGFVVAGLIPVIVLGAMASYLTQRAIEDQTKEDAERGIIAEAKWLSHYVHESREALMIAAHNPIAIEAVQARNVQVMRAALESVHQFRPAFSSLGVLTAEGDAWVVTGEAAGVSGNFADRDLFQGALAAATYYVSKPFFNTQNRPVLVISIPIRDRGVLQGVISGALRLDTLTLTASLGSENFPVQVVDRRDGLIIRDVDPERVLKPLDESYLNALNQSTKAGITETAGDNRRFLIAYAPVEGTEWVALASQPISRVYSDVTRMSAAVIGLVAIAGMIAIILSQFVAREVTDRLADVQRAAGALAAGALDKRVQIEGTDELADLGKAFNEMADQIQAGQTELARVNSALQSAVRVRDDFISVASHEMKTPLTPIKGFSQSLLRQLERTDRPLDREQAAKILRLMNQQADRLNELVNDLLDTSRIRSGRFVLNRAPMDLVALCQEVADRFISQGEVNDHRLRLTSTTPMVTGEWDIRRLDQVITNLISNALRYSPAGSEVSVHIYHSSYNAVVSVGDQGIGIPVTSIPELFQPFYRAPNSVERFGGLGLGLYISREIVERHGGRIWAESPGPGLGSCFYVELPQTHTSSPSQAQPGTKTSASTSLD